MPTVVVGVGDSVRSPRLRGVLLKGTTSELRLLEPAATIKTVEDPDVGCLLANRPFPGTVGADLCRNVRARDASLPVVFYAEDPDGVHRKLLNASADGYYTPSDPLETVARAINEALEGYARHREVRMESTAFATLLKGGESNAYLKDATERHLRASPVPEIVDPRRRSAGPTPTSTGGRTRRWHAGLLRTTAGSSKRGRRSAARTNAMATMRPPARFGRRRPPGATAGGRASSGFRSTSPISNAPNTNSSASGPVRVVHRGPPPRSAQPLTGCHRSPRTR